MIANKDEEENIPASKNLLLRQLGTKHKKLILGLRKMRSKLYSCFIDFMERTLLMSMGDWIQMESQQMQSMDRK